MTYDYTIEPHRPDVLVDLIERMMNEFSLAPSFPGLQFKKIARRWRKTIRDVGYVPFQFVQRQMEAGRAKTSYISKAIESFVTVNDAPGVPQLSYEDAECIVWTAASLYGGASDTTVVVLTTFTLAMIQWPEVQRKAQEEIDQVYSSPEVFDPERFLKSRDEPDPGSDAFGYGRRVCPGRHFADASIYLNIVQVLATFNMEHAVEAAGNKIPVQVHGTHGILNHPSKFRFKVSPRSAQHEELIRKVGVEHPWEKSDASLLGGDGWA
ncbi:cytochrome P450 [Emericellopsis atlantica]|uniref:Cytochrome P450 n=1 Tax=Emericellopsis atlantica TaxID=2614577 RepID=A0A9P8CMR7_9HYPO|nr:cytochrome P450 [Emericellopsis atlantica]KAG9252300.1 cytochrome P450 [Emericellopsis atlantica]